MPALLPATALTQLFIGVVHSTEILMQNIAPSYVYNRRLHLKISEKLLACDWGRLLATPGSAKGENELEGKRGPSQIKSLAELNLQGIVSKFPANGIRGVSIISPFTTELLLHTCILCK